MSTVTRESLQISQQITMFIANTITEIAQDDKNRTTNTGSTPRQPKNVKEGLKKAATSMNREIDSVIESVIAIPVRQYERNGPGGALKSVVRALPIAMLRPIGMPINFFI